MGGAIQSATGVVPDALIDDQNFARFQNKRLYILCLCMAGRVGCGQRHHNGTVIAADHQFPGLGMAFHSGHGIGRIGLDIGHAEVRRLIHTVAVGHPALPAFPLKACIVSQTGNNAVLSEAFRGRTLGFDLLHTVCLLHNATCTGAGWTAFQAVSSGSLSLWERK